MSDAGPNRSAGRPRALTLEALLDAVDELGAPAVSMKSIAARLGVGVGTLYRYVRDRDELMMLAAGRSAHRQPPADAGQDWPAVLRGYAESAYSSLASSRERIDVYLDGGLGSEVEVEFLDGFLAAMTARGFAVEEASRLFMLLGTIALGAAVANLHLAAVEAKGVGFAHSMHVSLAARSAAELPALRAALGPYLNTRAAFDWHDGVDHLIRSVATDRGETVP